MGLYAYKNGLKRTILRNIYLSVFLFDSLKKKHIYVLLPEGVVDP